MTGAPLEIVERGDVVVVRLTGEIDLAAGRGLLEDLLSATPNDARGLVLELSGVRYIDSAGVRVIFEVARRLAICRQRLALAVPEASPLRKLIKITKLEEVVVLCATHPECIESLVER